LSQQSLLDVLKREVEQANRKAEESRRELQHVIGASQRSCMQCFAYSVADSVQLAQSAEAQSLRRQLDAKEDELRELKLSLADATNSLLHITQLHARRPTQHSG